MKRRTITIIAVLAAIGILAAILFMPFPKPISITVELPAKTAN